MCIWQFFVYNNGMLGFEASGIVAATALFFGKKPSLELLFIAFFLTTFTYLLNRMTDVKEDLVNNPKRTVFFLRNRRWLLPAHLIFFLASMMLAWLRNPPTLFFFLLTAVLVLLYSFKWLPQRRFKFLRLKEIPLLKSGYIAFGWALSVFLTAAFYELNNSFVPLFFILVFLRRFINVAACDFKDIKGDRKAGIRTLPIAFGVKKTQYLLHVLNVVAAGYLIFLIYAYELPGYLNALNAIFFFTAYYIERVGQLAGKARISDWSALVLDSEAVIWPILLVLGKAIVG